MKYWSSMQENTDECFLSGRMDALEWHHVFGGSRKKLSEKYGLMVRLNHWHHNEPPAGVHHNEQVMDFLHREGQKKFEESYGTREEFVSPKMFGRNYL